MVSCDSVHITFLVATLNDLDVMSADIGNAYLNAPNKEKIWTVAGHEFGTDKGAVFIISQALYGLKSARAAWRTSFTQAPTQLEFQPTCGDSDVYIKPQTRQMGPGITRCYLYMSMTFRSCPTTLSQSLMGLQANSD